MNQEGQPGLITLRKINTDDGHQGGVRLRGKEKITQPKAVYRMIKTELPQMAMQQRCKRAAYALQSRRNCAVIAAGDE
jgi:hypothetical protein